MNHTQKYYNKFQPHYSVERFAVIADWLSELKNKNISLLDAGCGDGSGLKYIQEKTGVKKLAGVEQDKNYLKIAKRQVEAVFFHQNILNLKLKNKYDIIIVAAVLHHLIGKTRKSSKELSALALNNCLDSISNSGRVIIMEPVFSNELLMTLVFYIKKIFCLFSYNRISFFGYWNNLGAPVVSYFSKRSLKKLIEASGAKIIKTKYIPAKPKKIYKILGLKRGDLYLMIENGVLRP